MITIKNPQVVWHLISQIRTLQGAGKALQEIGRQLAELEPRPVEPQQAGGRQYKEVLRDPNVKLATGALIFAQVTMVVVMVVTPVHMHNHNHGLSSISLVIMGHTLGMFGLSGLTGGLISRFGRLTMIAA